MEETRNSQELKVAAHYSDHRIRRKLTDLEIANGAIDINLDPYQIFDKYPNIPSEELRHIIKKGLRSGDKGHDEGFVLTEVLSTAKRRLEILKLKKLEF